VTRSYCGSNGSRSPGTNPNAIYATTTSSGATTTNVPCANAQPLRYRQPLYAATIASGIVPRRPATNASPNRAIKPINSLTHRPRPPRRSPRTWARGPVGQERPETELRQSVRRPESAAAAATAALSDKLAQSHLFERIAFSRPNRVRQVQPSTRLAAAEARRHFGTKPSGETRRSRRQLSTRTSSGVHTPDADSDGSSHSSNHQRQGDVNQAHRRGRRQNGRPLR